MDRFQALDILDALPPDRRLSPSSEVEEARRVLEADAEGRRQLEVRRQFESSHPFDLEIRRAVRDVAVPADARGRLLSRLAVTENSTATHPHEAATLGATAAATSLLPAELVRPAASPVDRLARTAKRRPILPLGRIAIAAAVVLVALLAWSFRPGPAATVALVEVRNSVPADTEELPPYTDAAFPPRFPDRWQSRIAFDVRNEQEFDFRELPLGPTGQVKAAICGFQLADRGRSRATGYLIAMPTARVVDPPSATSFTEALATPLYTAGMASVSWTDGDAVFVCMIRGEGNLKLLERALGIRLG